MTTIKAHFDGKTFVPDEPVHALVNQQVTVLLETAVAPYAPLTPQEFERLLAAMDRDAVTTNHPVDDSRDSIYSGTIDDPR
jgi:hypothetical protein